ncbi:arylsulfatase A-like enzyme [Haloactinopolyspora alba]|uniref:Arylsulfatase A-like enzyme n=1 Tax=Haloactinopolyspora alba TaxID=648780 RepID=A0A2P8E963_9ACTN|nr:sulfatase [Haloactinopolyspora alba]PSL05947.1 arylsulfatase A-like enzyme [Haloactinopolyspora alba]
MITNSTKKNVVLVVVDEWRAQSFGFAGDENAHTPAIDQLAAESLRYRQAISGTPVCCPARASFLTGQYPLDHGVYINDVELRPTGRTIAEVFRDEGYATGYVGKWHLYGSPDGWFGRRDAYVPPEARHGFQFWRAGECTHDYWNSVYYADDDPTPRVWPGYDSYAQTEQAAEFIEDRTAADEPFFLMLSYGPPHFPLDTAPEEFREHYNGRAIRVPGNVPSEHADSAADDLRGYYAHMAAIDECMSRLLRVIDATGRRDDTVVVFTSDHGDMMWSHGLQYKLVPWEESIRVPLLVRGPGIAPGDSDALFNSPDLMPTVLGFAGIAAPDGIQGTDFSDPSTTVDSAYLSVPAAYSTLRWYGIAEYRGVRTQRHTYVCAIDGPWLLFDNDADPGQSRNLVDDPDHAHVRDQLQEHLDEWRSRLRDEFLPGEYYIRRDQLEHYYEVNEPVGYSGRSSAGWASTIEAGRRWSIDTPLDMICDNADAAAIVARLVPELMPGHAPTVNGRDSVRLASLRHAGMIDEDRLSAVDEELAALGGRVNSCPDTVAIDRVV